MRRWSELADRLAATTRTSEKTALLAEYLRSLTPDELPIAAVFLTGRPFAEAIRAPSGSAGRPSRRPSPELAGVPRSALGEAYDRSRTWVCAVADVLREAGHDPRPSARRHSPRSPPRSRRSSRLRPGRKSALFRDLLALGPDHRQVHSSRCSSGELRIGLARACVEAAIAKAFDRPLTTSSGPGC
jgi:DNA ligase-1